MKPTAEINLKHTATSVHLPWLGILNISGADAACFLDQQLTVNASVLQPGAASIGCWCDAKGRSLCTLWIQRNDEDPTQFNLAMHASLLQTIASRLQMFVLRAAVQITVDEHCSMVADLATDQNHTPCWQALSRQPLDLSWTDISQAGRWARHEIESGFVWLDKQTSGQYLPQMLAMSRWQALDFGKGCFPGQEVIARAHYLGRVKRRLYRFQLPADTTTRPEVGDAIYASDASEQGQVVALVCCDGHYFGLGVLQSGNNSPDRVLCYCGDDVKFTLVDG